MRSPSAVLAALYKARGVEHPDLAGGGDDCAPDADEAKCVERLLRGATPAALGCVALDLVEEQGYDDKGAPLVKPNERLAAAKFALDCHRDVVESIARK